MLRRALLTLTLAAFAALPVTGRAAEGEKKPTPPRYLTIETLTVYTVRADRRRGVMTVDCGLDAPDPALYGRANALLPRLRAAYIETLQVYAGGLPAGYPPNPDYIGRSLQRDTDQILGKPGARVLLGAIVEN